MIGLYIGRFQPLHNGHLSVINRILAESSKLVIGVGSSNQEISVTNPFTLDERMRMIESSVNGEYEIIPIEDTNTDAEWMQIIGKKFKFDYLYTGSPIMEKLFKDYSYNVKKVSFLSTDDEENRSISATHIRDLMYINYPDWKRLVPEGAVKVIEEVHGEERVRELYRNALGYNKHL